MTIQYKHAPRRKHRGGWGKRFGRCDPIKRAERIDHILRRKELYATAEQCEGGEETTVSPEDADVKEGEEA